MEATLCNDNNIKAFCPGDTIPEWFNHCKEASNNTESCEIDIDGSDLYLDELRGIALCAVIKADSERSAFDLFHFLVLLRSLLTCAQII
ncbi:hypothetical protein I3843_15G135600 [Carya illinoinensis]|nr:hypothetical protein I3843_15G135600 [Carya illinoinensis]